MTITQILTNYTFWVVAGGSALLGILSGILGSFSVLRKQSLIGDAVAHSSLPGIAIAYIIFGTKQTWVLLLGALVSGLLSILIINLISRYSKLKYDSALALIMSVFFGLGLVLLSYIQRIPDANQAGLNKFIFGQASSILISDTLNILAVGIVLLAIIILLWKEFYIISFDSSYASTLGYPIKRLNMLLSLMTVITIIMGIQTVGAILMSAMLVAPAVAARQWTNKLWIMVLLASIIGALSGVLGTFVSAYAFKMPTGPSVILFVSGFVLISLLFARGRGIIWKVINRKQAAQKIKN